jgi:hypothetical protein
MEGERTNMEVDSPIIPSNDDPNDREEMEESNSFDSVLERASTVTHVQFGEESEVAPDRADRPLTGIVERTSTEEALAQPAADTSGDLEMELQSEIDRLQRDAEERAKDTEQENRGAESLATERAISVRRSMTDVEDALEEGTVHSATARSKDQAEACQELLDDTLVQGAERQDMGSIASTGRSATQASNKKAITKKNKRQGGIAKWAPYINRNGRAGREQRVTRVDFTEVELSSNQRSTSNVLQPAIEGHTENEPIRPEDRLLDSEGPGRSEVLPTTPGSNTVPDIVIHSIAEQADTPAAPVEPEVVESRQNSSDEGRATEPADLVMVEAASQPLKVSRKKSAQIKGQGQQTDPKWAPYDPTRRDNRKRVERHTPEREPQGRQHTRPVTQIIFSGLELAPSQQPLESEASTEHGLLHPEATIPGHSHISDDLDAPAVAQELLVSGELQGQVAGTVDKQAPQNRGPVTESPGPGPHEDAQESRAEKVVTRINFEEWAKTMVQEEHEASSMPAPEPAVTTEPRAETASPDDQPTTVMAESSQTARSARKILKPHIVVRPAQEVRRAPPAPNPSSQAVTITFRARGDDGGWKTIHELQVNPSDPSEVERVARKDARNRNATFYDKDLRKLTPAQCFEAAIEDETNTIFMEFDGELVVDEETMASIARDIEL